MDITFKIEKKHLYIFSIIVLAAIGLVTSVIVFAYNENYPTGGSADPSNFGHTADEIEIDCQQKSALTTAYCDPGYTLTGTGINCNGNDADYTRIIPNLATNSATALCSRGNAIAYVLCCKFG